LLGSLGRFNMRISIFVCKQRVVCKGSLRPSVDFNREYPMFRKDKVVFVMGATGTGKSRLAIDLATRYPAEIVNSDKMQVYKGLDVVTNKVTEEECRGVPHHLLGIIDPNTNFTTNDFLHQAPLTMESITSRDRLPIIAGGSNSYISALVNNHTEFRMKYDFCFIWVDVALHVLRSFISDRVDRMVEAGLVDEVRKMFDPKADYSRGIRRAIGVPELDKYLRVEAIVNDRTRARLLKEAIVKIKENTCMLAYRQLEKIRRIESKREWNMHRLDATEVFLKRGKEADDAWENLVAGPSSMIVRQFLYNEDRMATIVSQEVATAVISSPVPLPAVAR
jgi:adenylate isopentenyltransferase (cytokinin synthase)